MTNQPDDGQMSRRAFLRQGTGLFAGIAGLFGLAAATGLIAPPQRSGGYGSSPYGR